MNGVFRAFQSYNYRVWALGAIVSNVGTWMQRTAQDWLVLTQLTHNSATAVGITTAFQFGPQLLLLPLTGAAADRFDRRKLIIVTQSVMGVLALALGLMTVTHVIQLWEVYGFALLLGCAAAFDAPVRQTFVNSLADKDHLANAVALNSTSFNIARMIGPAVAGLLIAAVGTGWVFLINALSFAAVLTSLRFIRKDQLIQNRKPNTRVGLTDGFKYIRAHPNILTILVMISLIGTFGLNFPVFVSTMNVTVFHADSAAYGFLSTLLAIGSVVGALAAARRERPRIAYLLGGSALFGFGLAAAAMMPSYWLFGVFLIVVGVAAQTVTTSANSIVQLSTPNYLRGRVMAVYMAVFAGTTPIGAPIVGAVADAYGPRWGIGVGAAGGLLAAFVAVFYLAKYQGLRLRFTAYRPHVELQPTQAIRLPQTEPVPQVDTHTGSIET